MPANQAWVTWPFLKTSWHLLSWEKREGRGSFPKTVSVLPPEGEGMDAGQEGQQTASTFKNCMEKGVLVRRKGRSKNFIKSWPLR